ncbi:DinB family protein [Maribellus sp. CM-23]|uniref:DinB family protein n=1 Tax=Maribellus sp. CM-23 TaxID=2781026 RepID=UPI001F32AE5D|nr:DinB family protein [Maribellus sp. CM-23]MCE4565751.1 DinB family protein [Maribellus sp. CM-23]
MFDRIANELNTLLVEWENKLILLSEEQVSVPRNGQGRNIRQIVGHMVDSASNNTHRIVHLQYNEIPLIFPNYATHGNNDRWISIQNYENENWENLVNLWKYLHLHIIHVIQQINPEKLQNEWVADKDQKVSLRDMVDDFPRHFRLHLSEIEELLKPDKK